jgi:CHASE3 domain sensor protein
MNTKETRKNIIRAGRKAVDELIKVAEEKIITHTDDDVSADRLKNAAATKKLCIMDAFEILQRIEEEEAILSGKPKEEKKERLFKFAEGRSK